MASLTAWKTSGEVLFDTNLISYGLVKSGYMSLQQYWTRKSLRSAQLDPNNGANWTESTIVSTATFADGLWGFTVNNAISPIVFITGSGTLNGTAVNGSSITFLYSNASTSTKFYCFDLMADTIAGSTYLKTWNTSGRITFNSLQPPLNVIAAIQAPAPPPSQDVYGRYLLTYANGSQRIRQYSGNVGGIVYTSQTDCYIDIPVGSPSDEYAVYLPWSRSCGIWDGSSVVPPRNYSGVEGAYGRVGGISFMFGASAATTEATVSTTATGPGVTYSQLPTDRYPVALVIRTSNLIFPYN